MSPNRLVCEYQKSPIGIDTPKPRLSWWLTSSQRNQVQAGYQIVVSSTRDKLERGQFDLWNSGHVRSDQSVFVEYGGKTLKSEQQCWWKVRVWDGSGKQSHWSEPSLWTMGILRPVDWKGKWIGATDQLSNLKTFSVHGYHALESRTESDSKWVQLDLGKIMPIDSIVLYPPKPAGFEQAKGFGFPVRFRIEAANEPTFDHPTIVKDQTQADFPNPGDHAAKFAGSAIQGRYVRITATKLWNRHSGPEPYCFALSEVEVLSLGKNVALTSKISAKDSVENSTWSTHRLNDGEKFDGLGTSAQSVPGNAALMLRKDFSAKRNIRRATAFLCGLGYSELMLNGKKVSDHILDPGFTDYRKRALYVSYDVTSYLKAGKNAVGIMLGGGWFNAPVPDLFSFESAGWSMSPRALMHLTLEYTDGTKQVISTDPTWKWSTGAIRFNGIRGGETIDANFDQPGWAMPSFHADHWKSVKLVLAPKGRLVSQQAPPIRVHESIRPTSVREVKPGTYLFDLGRNIAGFAHIRTKGPKGTKVTLQYNEALLADGTVDMNHTHSHTYGRFQTDEFILAGKGVESFEPRFTYHGFRYVQVSGLAEKPNLDTLTGKWVSTDPEESGEFTCTDSRINRLQTLFKRTYLNNLHSIPTDCPQREKMGWMDDGCVDMELGFMNYDTPNFYTKWIHDMQDAQDSNGHVSDIVPTSDWGRSHRGNEPGDMADPWWGGAIVMAPWKLYQQYGDKRILEEGFSSMKRYVDYLTSTAKDNCIEWGLGDWLDESAGGGGRRVPVIQTSTAAYFYQADIVSKSAAILGNVNEAKEYGALASQIKRRFVERFYDSKSGRFAKDSETAQAIPIAVGIAPFVGQELLFSIVERADHISSGIVGTLYVFHAMSMVGSESFLWRMLSNDTFPGWIYMADHGATSLWEDWKGENSLNHPTLGCVGYWLYDGLGGIRTDSKSPGYKHFEIKPIRPDPLEMELKGANASYNSVYGKIACSWKRDHNSYMLDVTIPPNTTARVYVPTWSPKYVTESGRPLSNGGKHWPGYADFDLGSGTYHFKTTIDWHE